MTFASLEFSTVIPPPPVVSPNPSLAPTSCHREWALSPPPPPSPPPSHHSSHNHHHKSHSRSYQNGNDHARGEVISKSSFASPSTSYNTGTNNQKQQKKGKRVSLHPTVTVYSVLHYKDYTPKEIKNTWYRKNELKSIRAVYRGLLRNCGSEGDNDSNDTMNVIPANAINTGMEPIAFGTFNGECLRGLEGKTTEGHDRKFYVRRVAKEAVMWEQYRQRHLGFHDEDLLADLYFECAEGAQVAAYLLGLRDEQEARKCNTSTDGQDHRRHHHYRHRYHQHQDDGMEVEILSERELWTSETGPRSKIPRLSFSSPSSWSRSNAAAVSYVQDELDGMNDENMIPTSPILTKPNKGDVPGRPRNNMKSLITYSVCQAWPASSMNR